MSLVLHIRAIVEPHTAIRTATINCVGVIGVLLAIVVEETL